MAVHDGINVKRIINHMRNNMSPQDWQTYVEDAITAVICILFVGLLYGWFA